MRTIVALAFLAFSSLISVAAAKPVDPRFLPMLYCFKDANFIGLNEKLASTLCAGATSPAPLDCYREGDSQAVLYLQKHQLAVLCSGATSNFPIDCFKAAYKDLFLNNDQAAKLCSGATTVTPLQCYKELEPLIWNKDNTVNICRENLHPKPAFGRPQPRR